VLDQRLLPRRVHYVSCRTAKEVAKATTDMVLRGAPLIGCAAAYGMALAARRGRMKDVLAAEPVLRRAPPDGHQPDARSRPYAGSGEVRPGGVAPPPAMAAAAVKYYEDDIEFNATMAELGASLLKKGSNVITHCNAGALATAGIGTAVGMIRAGWLAGKVDHVYPCETRPYLQGSRLTLWELMQAGIPATLITDNMAAHLMKTQKIDAVIVGSDRIAANADVCNKIGTYGLAILAKHHGIPFYVVAPSTTVDLKTPVGRPYPDRGALRAGGRRSLRHAHRAEGGEGAPLRVRRHSARARHRHRHREGDRVPCGRRNPEKRYSLPDEHKRTIFQRPASGRR